MKTKKMTHVFNIIWDLDTEEELGKDVPNLPYSLLVPIDKNEENLEDAIADYLSDNYGWCVKSFEHYQIEKK